MYIVFKIIHCEWKYTHFVKLHILCLQYQNSFFRVQIGKCYTWLNFFTQPAVVMVVTNSGYGWRIPFNINPPQRLLSAFQRYGQCLCQLYLCRCRLTHQNILEWPCACKLYILRHIKTPRACSRRVSHTVQWISVVQWIFSQRKIESTFVGKKTVFQIYLSSSRCLFDDGLVSN